MSNAKAIEPPTVRDTTQDKTLQQSPRAKLLSLSDIVANLLANRGLSLSVSKPINCNHYMAALTTTFDRKRVAIGTADSPSEAVIAVVGQFLGRRR